MDAESTATPNAVIVMVTNPVDVLTLAAVVTCVLLGQWQLGRAGATGGLAESLAADIPSLEAVDPVLTLTGLRLIWTRNRAAGR